MRRFLRKISNSIPQSNPIKNLVFRNKFKSLNKFNLFEKLQTSKLNPYLNSFQAQQSHEEFLQKVRHSSKKKNNKNEEDDDDDDYEQSYESESIGPNDRQFYKNLKIGLLVALGLKLLWILIDKDHPEIIINELIQELKNENVKDVTIYRKQGKVSFFYAVVELRNGQKKTLYLGMNTQSLINLLKDYGIIVKTNMTPFTMEGIVQRLELLSLGFFKSILVILMILFFLQKKKKDYNWAQTKILRNKSKTKFNEVAGIDEVLIEMTEFVDYLKRPKLYQAMGAKIPKGALLSGPPGTGKTLLVKACAGEAEVPFFSVSGSDFVEMYVGLGASRVREIFDMAKEYAPCIIFIDEIDAIGKKRNQFDLVGERDQTLNQLLTEMDGFDSEAGRVIIFAATNQPDVLDPALIRPGRFDRNIQVTLPDLKGRKEILKVHLKGKTIDYSSFEKVQNSKETGIK